MDGDIKGLVTKLSVGGDGPNSAMAEFSILSDHGESTYVIVAHPATEPQVFTSMVAILAAALFAERSVRVTYKLQVGMTPKCIAVFAQK